METFGVFQFKICQMQKIEFKLDQIYKLDLIIRPRFRSLIKLHAQIIKCVFQLMAYYLSSGIIQISVGMILNNKVRAYKTELNA